MSVRVSTEKCLDDELDDSLRIWHLSRDMPNEMRAELGLPWVTLCGLTRPARKESRNDWELAAMEKCAVCRSIWLGA